jgi:hypothetical protein
MTAALDLLVEAVATHGHLSLTSSPYATSLQTLSTEKEKERGGVTQREERGMPRHASLHHLPSVNSITEVPTDSSAETSRIAFLGVEKKTPKLGMSSASLPDVCTLSLSDYRSVDDDLSDVEFDSATPSTSDGVDSLHDHRDAFHDVTDNRISGVDEPPPDVLSPHQWSNGQPHFHECCPCLSPSLLLLLSRLLKCLLHGDLLSLWCCDGAHARKDSSEEGSREREGERRECVSLSGYKIPTKVSVASSALAALTQFAAVYFPCFWSLLLASRALPSFSLSSSSSVDSHTSSPLSPSLSSHTESAGGGVTLLEVIVSVYSQQTDPLLRGHVASLCGQVISSLLSSPAPLLPPSPPSPPSLSPPDTVPPFPFASQSQCGDMIHWLFAHTLKGLEDTSATTSKLAIRGLSLSLPLLTVSHFASLSLPAVRSLLMFPPSTYWLVKKEILSVFGSLNFSALKRQQQQCVSDWQSRQMASEILFHSEGMRCAPDIQDEVIGFVLTQVIDPDYRVRTAAAECLVDMVPLLCSDSQVGDFPFVFLFFSSLLAIGQNVSLHSSPFSSRHIAWLVLPTLRRHDFYIVTSASPMISCSNFGKSSSQTFLF